MAVIGADVDNSDIYDIVNKYDLVDRVWFYGACYDEPMIAKLLFNSDDYSNHGPEFEAVESGVTGDFFKKDNLDDLCLKIRSWIRLESKRRQVIRRNAYKIIDEKYNEANQIKILKKLLNRK
ncbi:MAG: hypothetical protein KJO53_00650 [Eudoraea sp.]|nr:hypothetical protein [Eudoraea sp.]